MKTVTFELDDAIYDKMTELLQPAGLTIADVAKKAATLALTTMAVNPEGAFAVIEAMDAVPGLAEKMRDLRKEPDENNK